MNHRLDTSQALLLPLVLQSSDSHVLGGVICSYQSSCVASDGSRCETDEIDMEKFPNTE
jgi:hypothetical protein